MTELIIPAKVPALETLEERPIDRASRRIFLTLLKKIRKGKITLIEDDKQFIFGERSPANGLSAKIRVRHPRFYTRTVFGGTIGSGEAYMAGLWSPDDLTTVIRIVIQNQQVFEEMEKGWARLTEPLNTIYHTLNRNTRIGSRQNIVAHYDLGNDFYA
ncbi:MAG: hypothetical protein AB1Z18_08950, partial [Desulfobacterales bacterium]